MLDLVGRLYGGRVALGWRTAVLGAADTVAIAVVGRFAASVDLRGLVGVGELPVVLIAVGVLALTFSRQVQREHQAVQRLGRSTP